MNKITEVDCRIDFADCELISYSYSNKENAVTVNILLWNAKIAKITFIDPLLFVYCISDLLAKFCQQHNLLQHHQEALNRNYVKIPHDHPYKIYQFLDLDDKPAIEVMCAEYKYEICESKVEI